MTFKAHYAPGEHALWAEVMVRSTPLRQFRGYLMTSDVSRAVLDAVMASTNTMVHHNMNQLHGDGGFLDKVQQCWDFKASIADRFTRPGAVFH